MFPLIVVLFLKDNILNHFVLLSRNYWWTILVTDEILQRMEILNGFMKASRIVCRIFVCIFVSRVFSGWQLVGAKDFWIGYNDIWNHWNQVYQRRCKQQTRRWWQRYSFEQVVVGELLVIELDKFVWWGNTWNELLLYQWSYNISPQS